jgi:prephenate dehydrogenase
MWRDICVANADLLGAELARYSNKLVEVKKLLEKRDGAALEKLFTQAREAREEWLKSTWSGRRA